MMNKTVKILIAVLLVVAALLSFFKVSEIASSTDLYAKQIEYLNEKDDTIMTLAALSTAASAAVSMVPGDAGTPIADKLADLSTYFLLALCAVYLEKYLLTLTGFLSFRILIPVACVLLIVWLFVKRESFRYLAEKIAIFALAIVLVVPFSVKVSTMIENTYGFSIDDTAAYVEEITDEAVSSEEIQSAAKNAEEGGSLRGAISKLAEKITTGISDAVETVSGGVSGLVNKLQNLLSSMIEKLAVIIVTSCVIPILVLLLFMWLTKAILGLDAYIYFPKKDRKELPSPENTEK